MISEREVDTKLADADITEIQVRRNESPDSKIRAFVDVTLYNTIVITDIKVVEGKRGLFVSYPARQTKGFYKEIVTFKKDRIAEKEILEAAILASYIAGDPTATGADEDEDAPTPPTVGATPTPPTIREMPAMTATATAKVPIISSVALSISSMLKLVTPKRVLFW